MSTTLYPAVLRLDDNTLYKGWSFFDPAISCGEIVFNTGMTGYQEIMTDPSYSGQIVVFTYPELGNTGLNNYDSESTFIHIKGIVAKNICCFPSNWRSSLSLKQYIIKKKIPHIFGLDTRSLTRRLRLQGVMKGYIASQTLNHNPLNSLFDISNIDLVRRVTNSHVYSLNFFNNIYLNNLYSHLNYKIGQNKQFKNNINNIVLINFGVKNNIISRLLYYKCNIYILPATANYLQIFSYKPDGIILSNGPGDPVNVNYSVNTIKKLIHYTNIPIFGICMGHQLLSLALGFSTFKLKFGHRGLNHPCGLNQYSEITSQNHGFAVNSEFYQNTNLSDNSIINITHFNLNDSTVGGIQHSKKPIFSVQYHPEASPGPHDSDYLFKSFIELISVMKNFK
uniref:Carbamoyl phosphate synthase small chain n=1 Tax=Dipterocladia arabiensis TaxID=2007176 RepID=A0A1Z1M038_9FLOR|nr:carbamoyl phosphate synthase small subunit [Dipterocladia arabiensis]ARW59298.1 carbamoyl phosphate synthase small subunit [Dipterocladia arabiensis]